MDSEIDRALDAVPDDELLRRLGVLVSQSRRVEADLVAHIGEVDDRRLYARQAFPSMFAYCTERLHLSEAEAYRRISVARAARRHDVLLAMLRDGRLHLSGIALLAPFLTKDNCETLLGRASHRSKRQLEQLVAELNPRPDVPFAMRKLPQRPLESGSDGPGRDPAGASAVELVPGRVGAALVEPLSPARYKVQFTASAELRDKIERLTALMRSQVPDGDLGAIIEQAVTEKLERLEARRFAHTTAPRKTLADTDTSKASRHVPAAVRRAVRERDQDRCSFADETGRRCSEQHRLELHHRHPFGLGGDHRPDNVSLLCAAHNRLMAERDYEKAAIRGRVSKRDMTPRLRGA
jgi:hypothetical protein